MISPSAGKLSYVDSMLVSRRMFPERCSLWAIIRFRAITVRRRAGYLFTGAPGGERLFPVTPGLIRSAERLAAGPAAEGSAASAAGAVRVRECERARSAFSVQESRPVKASVEKRGSSLAVLYRLLVMTPVGGAVALLESGPWSPTPRPTPAP